MPREDGSTSAECIRSDAVLSSTCRQFLRDTSILILVLGHAVDSPIVPAECLLHKPTYVPALNAPVRAQCFIVLSPLSSRGSAHHSPTAQLSK